MISSISVGGSISSEGFLSSILLVVVIIVMVVIVVVILIVIVVVIVGVVIVVMIFEVVVVVDDVSLIFKLSFVIIGVPVGSVFLLGLLALAIAAVCAFRAEEMPLVIGCWMAAKVMAGVSDVDHLEAARGYGMIHNDEDGDNDANDGDDDEREINNVVEEEDREWIRFLGGNNSLGTKKYRGSNSSDGGNTKDGVKIAGGVIGSGDEIGPYTPSTVTILVVPATDDSPEVPERTAVETILNMSPKNKDHYESKKEAIHLLLTGIEDEIYSTVNACKTAYDM
ncbi:hypothetical protein Tco_0680884 [Tanacetum coccineum]|uniref:Uncharacterized protein n=1 Tax=Tanacetum coccineum TaxID=301880 RepID=A0ABQ4XMX5_9ASTR